MNIPDAFRKTGFAPSAGAYLHSGITFLSRRRVPLADMTYWLTESQDAVMTTFVIADLDSEGGIIMMREALRSLVS